MHHVHKRVTGSNGAAKQMTIPEARGMIDRAIQLIHQGDTKEAVALLQDAKSKMFRAPHVKPRAPVTAKRVTRTMVRSVKRMVRQFPRMSMVEIARHHNTGTGRITEILQGRYDQNGDKQ